MRDPGSYPVAFGSPTTRPQGGFPPVVEDRSETATSTHRFAIAGPRLTRPWMRQPVRSRNANAMSCDPQAR